MPETNDKEKEEDMGYRNPKWPRHWTVERYKGEAPKDYAIIQWETAAFYTFDAEKDGKPLAFGFPGYYNQTTQMSVGITRLGSSRQRASITWETFDMSAKAGIHYQKVEPTEVIFEPGENHKDVFVVVIPNPAFDGTLEFGLFIDKKNAKGAEIGKYLHTSSIKIIDSNAFPSDKIRHDVLGGDPEKIKKVKPFTLIWEFVLLCFDLTKMGSIKGIFQHTYNNVRAIMNTFIMLYLLKELTATKKENSDRFLILITLGVLWIVPFGGTHLLEYYRVRYWGVVGSLRERFQIMLLKKFLNYTDESRNKVPAGELVMSMVRDVTNAVVDGYTETFNLMFGTVPRIFLLILTMLYIQTAESSGEVNYQPLLAMLFIPACMYAFVQHRQEKLFKLRADQFDAESASTNSVIQTVLNYQLIADYDVRTAEIDKYTKVYKKFRKASTMISATSTNSKMFADWLTTVLIGGWIIVGGRQVLQDESVLPAFLTTISLFQSVSSELQSAYMQILKVTNSYASIAVVTEFMNMPIDVPKRLQVMRKRRKHGKQMRLAFREEIKSGKRKKLDESKEAGVDCLPIVMDEIHFHYEPQKKLSKAAAKDQGHSEVTEKGAESQVASSSAVAAAAAPQGSKLDGTIGDGVSVSSKGASDIDDLDFGELRDVEMELEQGKLVALVGPPSQGKSTAMRLLAAQVFPLEKSLVPKDYVPPAGETKERHSFNLMSPKKKMHALPRVDRRSLEKINFDRNSLDSIKNFKPKFQKPQLFGRGRKGEQPDTTDLEAGGEPVRKLSADEEPDTAPKPPKRVGIGGFMARGNRNSRASRESLELAGELGRKSNDDAVVEVEAQPVVSQVSPVHSSENSTEMLQEAKEDEGEKHEKKKEKSLLFVPPHLRIVQIQETPMILGPKETIFDNLTYGIKYPTPQDKENDKEKQELRCKKIMRRLGFHEVVLQKHLHEKNFLGTAGIKITRADRQLISIGRALVMNPEVIIAHKPTAILNETQADNVLDMFKEFVENRGVFMNPEEPLVKRRRRTLIYSAKSERTAVVADMVFCAAGGRIKPLKLTDSNGKLLPEEERIKAISKGFEGKGDIDNEHDVGSGFKSRLMRGRRGRKNK